MSRSVGQQYAQYMYTADQLAAEVSKITQPGQFHC